MIQRKFIFKSRGVHETIAFGVTLGELLSRGHVVALVGELGAGKTTLVKGIAQGLGVNDRRAVKSPTFSLVHRYEGRIPIYHFDAYRLEGDREMFAIGSDEMLYGDGVSLIEWADRVSGCLPQEYLKITLMLVSDNERYIELQGYGEHYTKIIEKLHLA